MYLSFLSDEGVYMVSTGVTKCFLVVCTSFMEAERKFASCGVNLPHKVEASMVISTKVASASLTGQPRSNPEVYPALVFIGII